MAEWSKTPQWIPMSDINNGEQYNAQDGVTVDDMNTIINNMLYIKIHCGRTVVFGTDATVQGNTLVLRSKEV